MANQAPHERLVPLTEEARRQLSDRIKMALDAAIASRQDLHIRWERNEEFYYDCPSKAINWNPLGYPASHFPLTSPRGAALADSVLETIFAQDPVVRPEMTGPSNDIELAESIMDYFLKYDKLEEKLREACPVTFNTNCAVLRLLWDERKACPHAELTHPRDFVMHDPNVHRLNNCQFAGFKYNRSAPEVKRSLDSGEFYQGLQLSTQAAKVNKTRESDTNRLAESGASHPADKAVEFYELFAVLNLKDIEGQPLENLDDPTKEPGEYRPYLVIYAPEAAQVCSVQEFQLENAPYADLRFMAHQYGSFWSSFSVGQSLQGLQEDYNHAWNLIKFGLYYAAFPHTSRVKALAGLKNQKIGIGGESEHLPGNPPVTLQNNFDGAGMLTMIPMIERLADSVAGVSQTAQGVQFSEKRTLGSDQMVQQGSNTRMSGYIQTFGLGIERLCSLIAEMLIATFQEWVPVHGPKIPGFEAGKALAVLQRATTWVVQGRSREQSPQAMVQKMQLLLELCEKMGPMPEEIAVHVAQEVATIVQQLGGDPAMAQQVGQGVAQKVLAAAGGPIDKMEVIRTIVNQIGAPNKAQLLREDETNGATQDPNGSPALQALTQLLGGAAGAGMGVPQGGGPGGMPGNPGQAPFGQQGAA